MFGNRQPKSPWAPTHAFQDSLVGIRIGSLVRWNTGQWDGQEFWMSDQDLADLNDDEGIARVSTAMENWLSSDGGCATEV